MAENATTLKREIGLFGALMMGLGSIVGTGVFVSIGIGAGIVGPAVVVAIAMAALVAMCNAFSSAQLAAAHPVSGGTYEYGYTFLNPTLGFTAGWMFLCAKSASAATAALGFAGYFLHTFGVSGDWHVPLACATALLVTCLVLSGIRRSNIVNTVIVSLTLLTLFCFVGLGASDAIERSAENFSPFVDSGEEPSWYALCLATALMFVAYTGYGRIATLGEEVKEPRKTIPKAIVLTLLVSALLYIGVSAVAVGVLGARPFAQATEGVAAPLEVAAGAMSASWVRRLVAVGAMTAMLGVLLNLVLGLSRVLLAMGRRRDMPSATEKLSQAGNPNVAVVIVGLIIAGLALFGSVKTTWSFSAFTVLVYYAITNLAALRLKAEQRLYPRAFSWAGLIACLGLAFFIDLPVLGAGVLLILFGIGWHHLAKRQSTVG